MHATGLLTPPTLLRRSLTALFVFLVAVIGCGREQNRPLFRLLSPSQTGVTFANTITTNDSVNEQTDVYIYNGAGVAVGDIDNDGLPDIFFTGNMVSSRLYLNNGNMQFEDITRTAGVTTHGWATGATLVDIDHDGFLDIYVSMSGRAQSTPSARANLLFINNGNRTFTEAAARYGIADTGFTTHADFFDYDGDGDLDLFLLNNSPQDFARGEVAIHPAGIRGTTPGSYNQLYRNNGDGTFTNVSREAGILRQPGYGLGVVVSDLNNDGKPDIYVSNDLQPNDVIYMNNGNGTFTDKAAAWLKHTSFAGMGVDVADFNNDGWADIIQVDMKPHALAARKRMSGFLTYSSQMAYQSRGLRVDYDVNSLQLNDGVTQDGNVTFSEIGRMAGVAYTDWSWSPLFADFDNDGLKDLFITNGYPKAVNDLDYQMAVFSARRAGDSAKALQLLRELHSYDASNYLYRNNGDLTFSDRSRAWGVDQPGFSYGAAYADLNNDGRLDLVVNNIDAPATIYQNVAPAGENNHYLQIALQGDSPNLRGIGAKLILTTGRTKQYLYHTPYRGYMSTMDDREHFGLGAAMRIDSLEIIWPDGRSQVLTDLTVDRLLTVKEADARRLTSGSRPAATGDRPFRRLDARFALRYKQEVSPFVDYSVQALLPDLPSRQGPPIAVADVNGDGLEDVFIGGGAGVPGKLFLQRAGGGFVESSQGQPWAADRDYEDWGALLFDANGDGRPDLYVSSCGYQLSPVSRLLQDRLYVNQGGGRFVKDSQALPDMPTCTARVVAGDFTGDGKPDLFVGGRLVPRNYPFPTRSYLLRNDGGRFTDVTQERASDLISPGGMITDAVWTDLDGDGRLDLVTAGQWMPIQVFKNEGTRFLNVTASLGLPAMRGWWYSLAAGDFNHDGRIDLVAGNLGLNHTYTTSRDSMFGLYAGDFTGNRTTDVVLTQFAQGREYPIAGLATLGRAIYTVGIKFPTYASFSNATVQDAFGAAPLTHALHYQADTFASVYLENAGSGFTVTRLPQLAQISPIRGIVPYDVDGDGNLDLLVAGNLYDVEANTPRADAGNGLWLKGDGRGHFTPVPVGESGFFAPLNVTRLALVQTPAGKAVFVTNSGDSLQASVIRRR